jgi:hypothetical protein
MADTRITGGNIAGCERVKVVTLEEAPRTYVVEAMTGISFAANVSEGAEKELRVKNTIFGALRTEDIVRGYDIQLDDPLLHSQILALVDGGAMNGDAYAAPAVGEAVSRTAFDLYAYSADRDADGEAIAYHEWKFPSCKGRPIEGALKDGEFTTLSYRIQSRPASGVSPLTVRRIEALPDTEG